LISNISDIYCELRQPERGEQLMRGELSGMIMTGIQNIGTGRRLQLSLVETLISQRSFMEAQSVLSDLAKAYEEIASDAKFEGDSHLRMLICQARVYHLQSQWQDALNTWRQALSLTQTSGRRPGINTALIQFSIVHALQQLGLQEDSISMLDKAKSHLQNEPRRYWIACFNSHWSDYITRVIQVPRP
jgi:tetratricopeptide (TPR) repeat protein